jgi:ribulose-phosphate 3-epimerase
VTGGPPGNRGLQISASILSADFAALGEAIRAAERGGADRVHVDVMDGHFVPPITMGPIVVEAVRRTTRLPIDVHLMVDAPERHLTAFARAGATSLTVHIEATPDARRALGAIRALGAAAGIALNPATPADVAIDLRDALDLVLVMSVNPGYAGQAFIPSVLPKITRLREACGPHVPIGVDGGVSPETAPAAAAAGATVLVAASAIFCAPEGIEAAIARLRALASR